MVTLLAMEQRSNLQGTRLTTLDRWRHVRWWRSVSPVLQHNARNLTDFVEGRIAEVDDAWDERFEDASDRLQAFVAGLDRGQLGDPSNGTFTNVAEKFRHRELRALLIAHLATEMVSTVRARAKPLLDALEALDPDDHNAALGVGDLKGFDEFTAGLMPDGIVASATLAVDESVRSRSMRPVDDLLTDIGVSRVDDEFRNLLSFDSAAVAKRLERELARRTTTIDLRGDDPEIQLADTDEPLVSRPESQTAQA